jgi:hypothetical protein
MENFRDLGEYRFYWEEINFVATLVDDDCPYWVIEADGKQLGPNVIDDDFIDESWFEYEFKQRAMKQWHFYFM